MSAKKETPLKCFASRVWRDLEPFSLAVKKGNWFAPRIDIDLLLLVYFRHAREEF
jgi:hypothetical protein